MPITAFLRHQIGITLEAHRMGLLQARLRSRLQAKNFKSFTQFYEQVLKPDPNGWGAQLLIDLSTVNHTAFFREPGHFTFMAEKIAGVAQGIAGDDGADLVGGVLLRPGTLQHGDGHGRIADQPLATKSGNLGQ